MLSSSSEVEDDITANLREDPTPLPHPSPQHAKPQPPVQTSQSSLPLPNQQMLNDTSPGLLRKSSAPFPSDSGTVTPVDSPSIARRPLVYTHHTQGKDVSLTSLVFLSTSLY